MRRMPASAWVVGLVAAASPPSMGQDVPGVVIQPPAEVRPSPPIPAASAPMSAASAGLAPDVTPGAVARVPRPGPSDGVGLDLGPPSDLAPTTTGVAARPPRTASRPVSAEGGGTIPLVPSPTIAPALRPDDDPGPNPLLPTGPARARASRTAGEIVQDEAPMQRPPMVSDRGRPGLLGGLLGRRSARPQGDGSAPTRTAPVPAIDPDDPEAIEALRRGMERQIVGREGGRLATLEVLIVGRRVHLRAEAARPWQRRGLRRALEGIPMPPGFRSTVEVR